MYAPQITCCSKGRECESMSDSNRIGRQSEERLHVGVKIPNRRSKGMITSRVGLFSGGGILCPPRNPNRCHESTARRSFSVVGQAFLMIVEMNKAYRKVALRPVSTRPPTTGQSSRQHFFLPCASTAFQAQGLRAAQEKIRCTED